MAYEYSSAGRVSTIANARETLCSYTKKTFWGKVQWGEIWTAVKKKEKNLGGTQSSWNFEFFHAKYG